MIKFEECNVYKHKERDLYIGFFGGRVESINVNDVDIFPNDEIVKGLAIAFDKDYDPDTGYNDHQLLQWVCKIEFEEVKCEDCPYRHECQEE